MGEEEKVEEEEEEEEEEREEEGEEEREEEGEEEREGCGVVRFDSIRKSRRIPTISSARHLLECLSLFG